MTTWEIDSEDISVRLSRTRTWGGLDTESHYGPGPLDYRRDLGDPGEFPFTRGSYPRMYRGRMWTLRNIVGYGGPEDTREGVEAALKAGGAGIDVVSDVPTGQAMDPDHPVLGPDVGLEGCSMPTVDDLDLLTRDIDLTKTDVAWHTVMMTYPMVLALARRRGYDPSKLQGGHMPDHLTHAIIGWGHGVIPPALGHRYHTDCLAYACRHTPKWASGFPQGYEIRELGIGPAGEIAVGMAIVNQTLADLAARGVSADEVAPTLAWISTSGIDLFEEVAKFRALRRIWARTMRERHGARDERAMRLRISCHSSGRTMTYQQPLNNIVRGASEMIAALCGGVQSMEVCSYDEAIGIPTPEARELAIRTQQIVAHEVGAARVADPLGGSWYVEALTDRVEAKALRLLAEIEKIGIVKAVSDGVLERWCEDAEMRQLEEMETGERIIVGVNRFARPDEPEPRRFAVERWRIDRHLRRFAEFKAARDPERLARRMDDVYAAVRAGGEFHGALVEAFLAGATIGEAWGTVRVAAGYPYDAFDALDSPFGHLR
ncbi:methylmalonyl-CoA mutase family protein [Pseudonocardia eucalypti]|uniref:Methylmalonyl-CoA mutase family protein n=1 Tax=Pseudonocardia eucalypti TaxID=648755 RepID=A0ABP9PSE1_9PSEU|nr:methylmalonyl-CoA mutase N-terminal domain/subunit [Pseudonocardia eucalypti]